MWQVFLFVIINNFGCNRLSNGYYTSALVMQSLVLNVYLTIVGLFSVGCRAKSVSSSEVKVLKTGQILVPTAMHIIFVSVLLEAVLSDHEDPRLELESGTNKLAVGRSHCDRKSQFIVVKINKNVLKLQ
jgi:hypothetical protein